MKNLRLKFSYQNLTMWVFALGLVNNHDVYTKYEKIAEHITLSILI